MELGLFQLENLIGTRMRFCFLDLRRPENLVNPEELKALLKEAAPVDPEKVQSYLNENQIPISSPVVLLCEDGQISQKVARKLESSGFQNVYVVARGLTGLVSESRG